MKILKALILCSFVLAIYRISTGVTTNLQIILAGLLLLIIYIAFIFLLTQRINRQLWYWVIFGGVLLFNFSIAIVEDLDLMVWAKYVLPILSWPAVAIVTYVILKSKKDALSMYKWTESALLIPIVIFFIAIPTNMLFLINEEGVEAIRTTTIWREGIGHFGILLIFLGIPFLRSRRDFFSLIIVMLGSIALIISAVRTLWVSLIITLIISLLILRKAGTHTSSQFLREFSKRVLTGALSALIIVIALFLLFPQAGEPLASRASTLLGTKVVSDLSLVDRVHESQAIVKALINNPYGIVFGGGAGSYFPFEQRSSSLLGYQANISNYSHNFYLFLWWNFGVIGLALFLICLFKLCQSAYRLLNSEDFDTQAIALGVLMCVIATALSANFGSFYNYPRWYILFGILTGITIRLSDYSERRTEDEAAAYISIGEK